MPNYKVVNADELDAGLTDIANAIRNRRGENVDMEFPQGFVLGIEQIPVDLPNSYVNQMVEGTITSISTRAETIRKYAFYTCHELHFAEFPLATSIGERAFYECSNLSRLYLRSATAIPQYCCGVCRNLEIVDCGHATSISTYAFFSCNTLKAIVLRSTEMVSLANTIALRNCYCLTGTVDETYNPSGGKGVVLVKRAMLNGYLNATNWSGLGLQFKALEDYTAEGSIYGELDESKILAEFYGAAELPSVPSNPGSGEIM